MDLIPFGPGANCNLKLCPLEWSVFRYQPSIPANATLLAIFGVLLLIHATLGVKFKTNGYMVCMLAGCVLQIVGYSGRIILHDNPFDFNAFLMQISKWTLGLRVKIESSMLNGNQFALQLRRSSTVLLCTCFYRSCKSTLLQLDHLYCIANGRY